MHGGGGLIMMTTDENDDDDVVVRFRFRDQLCQTGKLPINYRCGDASAIEPPTYRRMGSHTLNRQTNAHNIPLNRTT